MSRLVTARSRASTLRLGVLATALVVAGTAAHAALPPQFQRVKEIRAILDDTAVTKAFDLTHPIDKIERVEHALYRVSSGTCAMDVRLESDPDVKHPPGWVGPWAFVVKAGPLVCK